MTWRAKLKFEKRDLWLGLFWDLKPRSAWTPPANGIYEVSAGSWSASEEQPVTRASTREEMRIDGISIATGDRVLIQEAPPLDLHLYICIVPCLPLHVWWET